MRKKTFTVVYKPGDILLVNFPFTDLISSKVRPAIVITAKGEDIIIIGIFSKFRKQFRIRGLSSRKQQNISQHQGPQKRSIIKTEKRLPLFITLLLKSIGYSAERYF